MTVRRRHLFLDKLPDSETGQLVEAGKFLEAASNLLQLYGSCGCNTKLLDYYAECRLCSKFSFPDFRLTAAIKTKTGVALCENCCETILSLCVPSEPGDSPGRAMSACCWGWREPPGTGWSSPTTPRSGSPPRG